MNKLTSREKVLLIFATSFILIFSLVNWGILPAWNEYVRVEEDLLKAQQEFLQAEAIIQKEEKYRTRYTAYHQAYEKIKSHFYLNLGENEAMLKFLALIEELALNSGVQIISKTAQGVTSVQDWKTIKINLTLKGTPEQLTELLLAFRNSPQALNVERLRIDLDQRNRLLQIKLVISTLILEEEGVGDV